MSMQGVSVSVQRVLSVGLVLIRTHVGEQIFSRRTLRRVNGSLCKQCTLCSRPLCPGDLAWGEAAAKSINRMDRICDRCMQRGIEVFEGKP